MRWFLAMAAGCAAPTADLVLRNGIVVTLDDALPRASAVAVRGDRIVAVGDDEQALAWRGEATRVIDLGGATVVPGLVDAHAHVESLGRAMERLDLRGAGSADEVAARVAKAAAGSAGWILGRGWDQNDWPDARFPARDSLDRAAPGRAVWLVRIDGHAGWASSEALRVAGVGRDTPDPPGGRILRDSAGDPSGVLVDEAMDLVARRVPPPDRATRERWIRAALERIAEVGLTGVHDMGVDEGGYAILRRLADRGLLKVRVYAVGAPEEAERLVETQPDDAGPFLARRAVKLYADGALGSRGAALVEEYADDPGNRGLLVTTRERIAAIARRALTNGWQVCVHAIGDRGNRVVLDAFDEAVGARRDHRFRVEHAQVVDPDDFPRFGALGVIASMQPVHWTSDSPWAGARLGPARMRGAYAWRSLRHAGATLAFGSDFPVEEPDPRLGLLAAVTRAGEGLDRTEALRAFTAGAAYAGFSEDRLGAVRAGMLADLTVLGDDLMVAPPDEIRSMRVLYTIVGGRVVHDGTRPAPPRERTIEVR